MNSSLKKSCGRPCAVMSLVLAMASGALLGAGLLISGMTQPAKVVAFLDPLRNWDPSLAFVMGGGVLAYAVLFRLVRRRHEPWFGAAFHLPTRRDIDAPLILGSALFGVGWGLGGLCPGPGLVSAASGSTTGLAFVIAMTAGMLLQQRVAART